MPRPPVKLAVRELARHGVRREQRTGREVEGGGPRADRRAGARLVRRAGRARSAPRERPARGLGPRARPAAAVPRSARQCRGDRRHAGGEGAPRGRRVRGRRAVRASWKGDVAVADFAALDKPTSGDLARWKTLSIDGLDVATGPFRASVGRIGIEDFYARVIVYQDGSLNLARLLTPGESPQPPPDAAAGAGAGQAAAREALPISIGRIDLERGNVNFSDFFVRPNYSVNLTDVAGSVSTMSAEQAGNISLIARVDRTAPVEVQGHIHPFAKELSLDIAAKARDIDLPPLTPYSSSTRATASRKASSRFDVRYQVENRKLSADNHLSSTSSPSATASTVPPPPSCRCCLRSRCSRTAWRDRPPVAGRRFARRSEVLGRRPDRPRDREPDHQGGRPRRSRCWPQRSAAARSCRRSRSPRAAPRSTPTARSASTRWARRSPTALRSSWRSAGTPTRPPIARRCAARPSRRR